MSTKKNPWSAKNNRVAAAVEAWEPKVVAMEDAERERIEADLKLDRQRLTVSSNVLHAAVATKLLTLDEGTLGLGILDMWSEATLPDRLGLDDVVRDLLLNHGELMATALKR
ncbi:MAG: hypothetical protein M3077_10055 [Candidatus Dormibacteraeota bacterium]|nr:hypothetical protein [Candidatus Dormibacteraeota bacterium]